MAQHRRDVTTVAGAQRIKACLIDSVHQYSIQRIIEEWCDKARVLGNISLPFSAYGNVHDGR